MPAHTKDVDWPAIRMRFKDGEPASAIARGVDVTRQAILKRARKEDWLEKGQALVPAIRGASPALIDQEYTSEATWRQFVEKTATGQRLVDPKTAADRSGVARGKCSVELLVKMLLLVDRAVPPSVAAKRHMIAPDSLSKWRRRDHGLDELFQAAEAGNACRRILRVEAAAARGDIASDRFILERSRITKEEFSKAGDRAGRAAEPINVIFNLSPPKPPEVVIESGDRWAKGPPGVTTHTLPNHRDGKDG